MLSRPTEHPSSFGGTDGRVTNRMCSGDLLQRIRRSCLIDVPDVDSSGITRPALAWNLLRPWHGTSGRTTTGARDGVGIRVPADDVVAGRQNDPTTGCPPTDATSGTGTRIDLAWAPVPGAVDYLGCVWQDGAKGEALACPGAEDPYRLLADSFHTTETRISFVRCWFSPDQFLGDTHWKVAARTANSGWGPYSAPAIFRLPPCRLTDGRACFAPPVTRGGEVATRRP
jgi:hypothetical protein